MAPQPELRVELRAPTAGHPISTAPWGAVGALGSSLIGTGLWARQRRQRTRGRVVALTAATQDWVALGTQAARRLFDRAEAALAALAAMGAPRLELLQVGEDGAVRAELAEPLALERPWRPEGERT